MLKNFKIIKKISGIISDVTEESTRKILNDFQSIEGREEEITAQIRGEFNRYLLDGVSKRLNEIENCKIEVSTFKKKQESFIGADFACILTYRNTSSDIFSKAFLVQAKIGNVHYDKKCASSFYVSSTNKDLQTQAKSMLDRTSDSFIFLYSKEGIFCIPAFQVMLSGRNKVDTRDSPYRKIGTFFEEFLKCFIGDHKISPQAIGAVENDLEDYAEKLKVKCVLHIAIKFPDKSD
jgi:hypothetical protein